VKSGLMKTSVADDRSWWKYELIKTGLSDEDLIWWRQE